MTTTITAWEWATVKNIRLGQRCSFMPACNAPRITGKITKAGKREAWMQRDDSGEFLRFTMRTCGRFKITWEKSACVLYVERGGR